MLPIVAALAGGLMKNGLGLLSKVIQKKGKEFIEKKTGMDLSKPDLTEEQLLQLKQFEMQNEQELLKIALEEKELEMKHEKMYLEDRQDARTMQEVALEQEDKFAKRFIYYYAIVMSVLAFGYIIAITFMEIPAENVHFVDVSLGFCLATVMASIIQFFFGSSSSSRDKDKAIQNGLSKNIKQK